MAVAKSAKADEITTSADAENVDLKADAPSTDGADTDKAMPVEAPTATTYLLGGLQPCPLCGSAACLSVDSVYCRTLKKSRSGGEVDAVCSSCGSQACFLAGGDYCRHTRQFRTARMNSGVQPDPLDVPTEPERRSFTT